MDKENGENTEGGSNSSKLSNTPDPSTLLDAASLFAYWPQGDNTNAANAANMFATSAGAAAYGLGPHPGMPFGLLPSSSSRGMPPGYPTSTTAAAAYNNAYTNTLSVAASQAASLGIPAASAAWWSMASHLAAQDYLARIQATGLNFPGLSNPADPYSSLGLSSLSNYQKSSKNTKNYNVSSLPKSQQGSNSTSKAKSLSSSHANVKIDSTALRTTSPTSYTKTTTSSTNVPKFSPSTSLTIQPSMKLPPTTTTSSTANSNNDRKTPKINDANYMKPDRPKNSSPKLSQSSVSSIFTNPLSLANNLEKNSVNTTTTTSESSTTSSSGLPSSILSDPSTILGGVRLPPDTEIIKYTSSIVGPKIPGTTNRGRKKTISLDPPSVSVHPTLSGGSLHVERTAKRSKLSESHDSPTSLNTSNDRVEVIKLSPTNGSPNNCGFSNSGGGLVEGISGDAPLNLSMKPCSTNLTSSSLNSLSNMSANLGVDRISRRKPGPKPRKVIQPSHLPPAAPSASLQQLFASADSPRSPNRLDDSLSNPLTSTSSCTIGSLPMPIHKDGRPRNLGRGISKPKKNTVASLLAQSRALGIKPMQVLDPNASMNQQISLLKSNILAAQQLMVEAGGDEKVFNKLLQEKFRGALSDSNSSTVDASTDSDNLTDSNHTDSEMETDSSMTVKKSKHFDERALRVPLEKGWKRETVIKALAKNGNIRGDVIYIAPDSSNKFKQMSDITQYLDYQDNVELTKENFTFSSRVILGDYLQVVPSGTSSEGSEFIRLTEDEVNRRLEEWKSVTRTNLAVEQRIEVARRQQAARAQARMEKEQARLQREMERSERQEAARREREARSQQLLEARRKRQEELEKHRHEEQQRKLQEREMKRQHTALLKEQERERRRQHIALVKALENRRKLEERERKKQQAFAEKQASKEKKLEQRRIELEILTELRKPCEDLELDQKPLPEYQRIPGLRLSGKAFADVLMVFEFLHNFGETLGFDMESLPTLDSLQQALLYNDSQMSEAEEELLSVMTHLLVCAIEDPGIPNPARHTTSLGQTLRQADITHANLSEILRIYLYANATGEVKALTGVHFERERERRVADHHQNGCEMMQTMQCGKNVTYYELLHDNDTWKMSDMLKDKPFLALSPTDKAAMLAFICNELLQNKAVIRQIDASLEGVTQLKKERWIMDAKIRKLRTLHNRKVRSENAEKVQVKVDGMETAESVIDFPVPHKDELLDDEENEISENESLGTQPEEEEDNKLSGEELGKKLEKFVKQSETQLQCLNHASHQLRATCYGQDRYWRRYWSLPKGGGVYVEAIESSDPEVLKQQEIYDATPENQITSIEDIKSVVTEDHDVHDEDKEVCNIVGEQSDTEVFSENVEKPNQNEHRKTPNRLNVVENGDVTDSCEQSLDELRKSVEKIVQSLDRNVDFNQGKNCGTNFCDNVRPSYNLDLNNHKQESQNHLEKSKFGSEDEQQHSIKKFNIFEKLGECMERENKTEEELKLEVKAEVKEELKNEILNELKSDKIDYKQEADDIKSEMEAKWFSILSKDCVTCEGSHLTQGNRWDTGVGACSRENMTELKIPVFPPPSNSSMYLMNSCDSPGPLQMTAEESVQMEYIKKHGLPKSCDRKKIPPEQRYGWWRIKDTETLKGVIESLHVRGARERELKRTFLNTMQCMYENQGKLHIDEGQKEATELGLNNEEVKMTSGDAPQPDEPGCWSQSVAHRVDTFLFEQVEALEDKVANASMQVKGWRLPSRESPDLPMGQLVELAKDRLISLESAIERRYLKPPLGVSTGDPNLAAIAQEASGGPPPAQLPIADDVPKGLVVWRDAVTRAHTSAQLAMCLYTLEASIAWDKSIMKAVSHSHVLTKQRARNYNTKLSNCQFCHNGDNEDKLLLCDGCDKGYHTYCFKPKMDNIPEGDWYCHECMNKATGERNCIVCGKKQSATSTRLLLCEVCPRAYHTDCLRPALNKAPRGKWYCVNCISKKPQKRAVRKSNTPKARDSESSDHPPASPAPSHSSATTNDDQQPINDLNSLSNASSPSMLGNRKERVSKKLIKELAPCKVILEDLECHDDAWPFLLPVNTKQFPTYKKIIKNPMDLSSIKKRLQDVQYKSRDEFCADVRQIFNNCETFNEDDSPVGKAGHCMRQFFESRWNELCLSHS
uniref:Bromodomain adjacent to zinc finger domain protein 2B n=1 Tax=Photinus pyralis TaxID=7054 RepID=A0A1Y1JV23_PHOPY